MGGQLTLERTAGLHEQRQIDRLVRHPHLRLVREGQDQPPGDLLRRPVLTQFPRNGLPQPQVGRELARLRASCPRPRGLITGRRSVAAATPIASHLPRDRRRRTTQSAGDGPDRLRRRQTSGDLLALSQRQRDRRPASRRWPNPACQTHVLANRRIRATQLPADHPKRHPRPDQPPDLQLVRHRHPLRHGTPSPQLRKCCDNPLRPPHLWASAFTRHEVPLNVSAAQVVPRRPGARPVQPDEKSIPREIRQPSRPPVGQRDRRRFEP